MSGMVETIRHAAFLACAKDDVGLVRKAQEDSHGMWGETPNGPLFVVCDGMGGHVGGSKASSLAVASIHDYLKSEKYADIEEAMKAALRYANDQILGYAQDHPEYRGMGTTACILLLQGDKAHIAHIGDSRIYLYLGKKQTLHRVTKDHSYVQTLVDAGEITDEEAEHHPNKNRILQALGAKQALRPGYQVICPQTGDIFLICSDGMSGMTTDACMERTLSEPISLEAKVNKLIQQALDGGGNDNVTVELVRIEKSPNVETKFTDYNPPKRISNVQPPVTPRTMPSVSPNPPRRRRNDGDEQCLSFIRRYGKWVLGVLLALGMIWGGIPIHKSSTMNSIKNDIQRLSEEYNYTDTIKKEKENELLNQQDKIGNIEQGEAEIQDNSSIVQKMNDKIVDLEREIGDLGNEIDTLNNEIENKRTVLGQLDTMSRFSYIKYLFNENHNDRSRPK